MLSRRLPSFISRRFSNLAVLINTGVKPKPQGLTNSVGLFGIEQLRDPSGFDQLTEGALNRTEEIRQQVREMSTNSQANVVELLDEMSDSLCQVADMAEFVRLAHPNEQFRTYAYNACAKISRYVEELNTDIKLYKSFKNQLSKLKDPVDARVGHLFLVDFEQSGIHLPDSKRQAFVEASEQIHSLGSAFQQHVDMPTLVDASLLPKSLSASLSRFFNYDRKSNSMAIDKFLADSIDRSLREGSYRLFYSKNKQVDHIIKLLIEERHYLAKLSGYENFAERTISENTLAGNVNFVKEIVDRVSDSTKQAAERDIARIKKAMLSDGIDQDPAPWDLVFYIRRLRDEAFKQESNYQMLRDYFSLGSVLSGLDRLFHSLYGVRMSLEAAREGELWSDDILKLAISDSNGETLGHVLLDLFERRQKPIMECHFTIRGGRQLSDGKYQTPVVVLMLNITPPNKGSPALLALSQIENLFHEFGHAMHSVLGRTKYQHVTGTRCPTDFAEVPSVLMESFACDHRVAQLYATHWENGKAASPDQLRRVLYGVKNAFRLFDLQQQLAYTEFDLTLHCPPPGEAPPTDNISTLYSNIWTKHSGIKMPDDVAQYQRFAHLVGYGSRYYSYLMSRAVADLLWKKLFDDDPLCIMTPSGMQIRKRMLEHGGMAEPQKLVESTLGLKSKLSAKEVADAIVSQTLDD